MYLQLSSPLFDLVELALLGCHLSSLFGLLEARLSLLVEVLYLEFR